MEVTTWINLQRIFVLFRYDIKNEDIYRVADIVIEVINNNISNEEMCKMIFVIMPKWKEQLIVKDNEETEVVCNKELKLFLIRALELIKGSISSHEYELAYDVADILQGLPEFLVTNQKKGLKQYWKIYVKPFQRKWRYNVFNNLKHVFR